MDKHYLTLRFDGYMLLQKINLRTLSTDEKEVIKEIMDKYNIKSYDILRGYNYKNVIPYTYLTNILVSLCGGVPIPTNPKRKEKIAKYIERTGIYDTFDAISKNSYFKIDSLFNNDNFIEQIVDKNQNSYCILKDGYKSFDGSEYMQGSKLKINSNKTKTTILFEDNPAKKDVISGEYNWRMLERVFNYKKSDESYQELISILNDIYGGNVLDLTFNTMCEFFHDNKDNDIIQEKINSNIDKIKEIWDKNDIRFWDQWMYVIFKLGRKSTSNNTSLQPNSIPKTFLREYKEVDHRKQRIIGEIIVEIEDERIVDALYENTGFCKFMEDGVCEIVDVTNYPPNFDYKDKWTKISDEKPFQKSIN